MHSLVDLAIATGIPPSAWADEGERAIATAKALIKASREKPAEVDTDGRQMSG